MNKKMKVLLFILGGLFIGAIFFFLWPIQTIFVSILSVLVALLTSVVLLVVYLFRQIAISKNEQKEKELAKNKLDSIRAQLNPHFMFNALAGIQNLMNKGNITEANHYLSLFARLTRNVLDSRELISLADERVLLEDYLRMEQLRFDFQFSCIVSDQLNVNNVEIPSMVLQPFVENAVKHGICDKAGEGNIEVSFTSQKKDLILKIKDNGKAFDATGSYDGMGLKLSRNRIQLLNTIYKNNPFVLDMKSDTNGTNITITLTEWL